jgi:hypothetical protein|tara:strand:- start:2184 stop:2585 length:402 start_codon:yes stop_codon:yes gene_type:complete
MLLLVLVLSSSLFEEYNSYPPPELVRSNRGKDPSLSSPPSIIPLLGPIFDLTKNELFFANAVDSLLLLSSSFSADKEEALKLPKSSVDLYRGEDKDDGILIVILPGEQRAQSVRLNERFRKQQTAREVLLLRA